MASEDRPPMLGSQAAQAPGETSLSPTAAAGSFGATSGASPIEPRATYRVQLHKGFDFDAAAELADYLAALGISHLYCSPLLQATPGSTHGYDVVDPRRVNHELGGEAGFARLQAALGRDHLAMLLDIVPNHMAISGRDNVWWWDVLENGPASRYARYFDIDWEPPESKLRNLVLMPILGDHYGRVLAAGQITLRREGGSFTFAYYDHVLPVSPRSLDTLLAEAARRTVSDDLAFLADGFAHLPPATATDTESVLRRHRDTEKLRTLLVELCEREAHVERAIDAVIAEINASPAALDALLERQNYRLSFWKASERELGYRRFFDINSLVGVRTEDAEVFEDTHALISRWLSEGVVDGLRIDHIDGLRDPDAYLARLRERAPRAWVVVEKILGPGERLPPSWPVAGTTGYDFLNRASGLFVDPAGEAPLTACYAEFTGEPTDYGSIVREKKLLVLRSTLNSDVNRLTAIWLTICRSHWRYRDYTWNELQEALCEVIACFPVYRTYVRVADPAGALVRPDDRRAIEEALAAAREHRPPSDADLLDFLGALLTLQVPQVRGEPSSPSSELASDLVPDFVLRFQQLTGPAMAKGAEDTAFYCFNRLVALNEVGGDPGRFGSSVEDFHMACAVNQRQWPQTMLASSTHDTKRSEDVRTRISLLAEIPDRWCATAHRWRDRNQQHWRDAEPDRNAEYLFYQTLVGAWPLALERAWAYMEKAIREAKTHTSWTAPNPEYEQAMKTFVEGALGDREFVADLEAFVAELREPWYVSALAQALLKLAAPGVPDIYQGTELWDLSLVDPDNRRPVDYNLRRRLLAELEGATPEAIWERRAEGLPKLYLIRQALALRARRPELFGLRSTYQPLLARGARAGHVVAFARGTAVVAVAPRLVIGLGGDWADTVLELPDGRWRSELTDDALETPEGGAVALGELLRRFPVALLAREDGGA